METYTVWACDHLWKRYDAKDLGAMAEIYSACHNQACDGNYSVGIVIPVCFDCENQGEHVVVSRRVVPHPFDEDAWTEVRAYEDQEQRNELA